MCRDRSRGYNECTEGVVVGGGLGWGWVAWVGWGA